MYAVTISDEGDCYRCFPPDPGIETSALGTCEGCCPRCLRDAAALGASTSASSGTGESALSGTESASASLTCTLDSGASRSFFRDRTTLTPLSRPVAVSLADPSGGPVLSHFSTVLPCPTAPSGTLSGLYLPSFSTNLVSGADLQDGLSSGTTPLVTPLSASSKRHGLRLLVSGLPRSLPPLPHGPGPTCVPCVEGRQRAAPHSSQFPPTEAPLQTLHMDVWGPARVRGQGHERYFPLVVDDYSRYTAVFPCAARTFTLLDSPQQNGIAERRIGMVMDVAPTSRRVLSSQDVTFDESVPYYRLFPYRTPSLPRPRSSLYQVPRVWGAAALGCAELGGAEPGGAVVEVLSLGVLILGVLSLGVLRLGVLSLGVLCLGVLSLGVLHLGVLSWGCWAWKCYAGGSPGASSLRESHSPQELREWFARRWSRAARAGGSSATEGAAVPSPGGARTGSTGAAGPAGPTGAGAAEGVGAEATAVGPGGGPAGGATGAARGTGAGGAAGAGAAAGGTGAVPAVPRVVARPRPYFVPLLQQVLGLPASTSPPPPLECPQPVPSQLQLQPASPQPAPSPYTGPTGGLAERLGLSSCCQSYCHASPCYYRHDPSFESTAAPALVAELVDFAARCRLDYAASLVAESESVCPPSVGGECALGTDVLEDRKEEFQCLAAASPHLVSVLLTPEGDPDALDIPTPRSYAEAIEGPYSSQWQAAMETEMTSWKSTGTYVDEVPPPGANIVSGMWIFRVKRPPGSPPVFKARNLARGFSQRQGVNYFQTFSPTPKMTTLQVLLHVAAHRDYELHSLDFNTAFLQGSLHEEIWLRRPPGFTWSFPPGTQWSLRRPVYGLRQAPHEWYDPLRTTLAALGFAPSTADPSLFLRTDTSLPPFYILVYVDDLVFATADTDGLAYVKSELQKRHTCTDLGELRS
ncbi:unnamed protein product [Closterium sp. NIES-64]|nr:unnamed protein product [Closterium sp. NIES-64]